MSRALATAALAAILAGAGCTRTAPAIADAPHIPERLAAGFPTAWRFDPGRRAIRADTAMVTSDEIHATRAGVEILRRGGNAIDAAVAVGFAQAVSYQEAGNLGGGGFMVIRMADGRTAAIDYRETAPASATRNMYVDAGGRLTRASEDGWLASGVPGAVAGLAEALKRHGTLPLADVLAPAIRLAEDGFIVSENFAKTVRDDSARFAKYGADSYLPRGNVPRPGSRFRQPALARTLRLIAEQGADAFYRGAIADSIAAEMKRNGGNITKKDLEDYRPKWRTPIRSEYRGYTLIMMPPASSGGITIGETLNILETFDTLPRFGTPAYFHVLASAFQRAFIDRNSKLGDPDFVKIPGRQLLSDGHARDLAKTIRLDRHVPTVQLMAAEGNGGKREGTETTHSSIVDRWGNAVATTTTVNSLFGSGVHLESVGFFMNNTMDDFAAQPGSPNQFGLIQGEVNAIKPGKRSLSAMSPTIVLDPEGNVLLIVGARGGPRIITSVAQIILNVIDHRMSIADAMAAPRIHHQALPDTIRYEENGLGAETRRELQRLGHGLALISGVGQANAILRVRGGWEAAVEPRRAAGHPDAVAGY